MPKRGTSPENLHQLNRKKGHRVLRSYPQLGDLKIVELAPGESVGEAVVRYRASGAVEFAEPDYKLHALASPDDPEFRRGTQWPLYNTGQFGGKVGSDISAVAGWDTIHSASNIVVAIVDSGIRYTHEDLAPNMWINPGETPANGVDDDRNGFIDDVHGIDAIVNGGDPTDDAGHGTHVAGIIGAAGNNGIGIAGVAWNVKLMALRFLSKAGDGDTSDAIQCIDYARRMGAHVINASWGGADYSAALYNAINAARSAGMIVVTAAGNDSEDIDLTPIYPACYNLDNVVVVGGSTRSDLLDSSYSSYGLSSVDLFAPGTGIYSTWHTWDGSYTSSTGTSMATPHVAGVIALMKARFTGYSSSQIISRLLATVDAVPGLAGKCKSGGRLNMARALGPNPAAGFTASTLFGEPPLTVAFTNTSFGDVTSHRWTFNDGSALDTNIHPTHIFEFPGTFKVKLEITGTNRMTNSFEQEVNVVANYEANAETFSWIDPAELPTFPLTDNGVSTEQPLPFPFRFYGETFQSIFISANGALAFSNASLTTSDNTNLPNPAAPNALICPYWDNLNPAAGGTIHAGVVGDAPNRKYVVSWVNVPRNSTAVNLSFQAVLEEASHQVVFQYLDVAPETSRGGAKRATVGIENASGTMAVRYTYNGSPIVIQNNTAVRFTQRAFRFLSIESANPIAFSLVRGQPADLPVTLRLRNSGNQDLNWEITSSAPWLSFPTSGGTLLPDSSLDLEVALSTAASDLPSGRFESAVQLANLNDGRGNRTIPVLLDILEPDPRLQVEWSSTSNVFSGGLGGPFSPQAITAILRNVGNIPVHWTASVSVPWLSIDSSEGDLSTADSASLSIRVSQSAEQLPSGQHLASLTLQIPDRPSIDLPIVLQVNSVIVPHSASMQNGIFRGTFTIPITGTYFIEASEDLVNWEVLDVEPSVSGSTITFEHTVNGKPVRFYRLLVTPPQ